MSKEKDKILRTLEHIAITFDKFGFSPTIPICTGHKDFNYLFRLEIDTIKELCEQQSQRISELEEQLKNAIVPKFKYGQDVWCVYPTNEHRQGFVFELDFVGYTKDKIICRITDNEEFEYDEVFTTKEEAESKLEELKGESE